MSSNQFQNLVNPSRLVDRTTKPFYTCERVLSTDVLPMVRAREYIQVLELIKESHKDSWYLQYGADCSDAFDLVRRIPTVTRQFNRSRVLRRAQISGARMCVLNDEAHNRYRYISDMVVSSTYDALVFASMLNTFQEFESSVEVIFKPLWVQGRNRKRILANKYEDMVEKFYRRSRLPRNAVRFSPLDDDYVTGTISVSLTTSKPLFDIVHILCTILAEDIDEIKFKGKAIFRMSRSKIVDEDDYTERPFSKMLHKFNFRRFSSFGMYANGQNIVSLKHAKL